MYAFKPHVFTKHSLYSITKPEGKIKALICGDGKNLYFNGESASDSEFHNIWEYNLAGQQWRLLISIRCLSKSPFTYDSIIGTILESNYLVICPIESQDTRPFNDELSSLTSQLHVCNLNSKSSLVRRTSGRIPNPSFPHNFIRHGKYLYTVGVSRDGGLFSDVYKLNMENDVCEIVYTCRGLDANEPVGRWYHTLVYGNNMIYIFGGYDLRPGKGPFSFPKISAFDLQNCCWKKIDTHGDGDENHTPRYPTGREGFSVTSYTDPDSGETNVIISGGADFKYEYKIDDEGRERFHRALLIGFSDVWRLNLTSLKWSYLQRFGIVLPRHVSDHSTTISPTGKLFIFDEHISDNDKEQKTCNSALYSTWVRIPKLTDICWEAVLHYFPNLKSMTDKEIISLGIPLQSFKSRIN
ncbi:kelch domain-containing protein 10 homolog [Microplitis mediator]|uniref:kelch domain-containing protein 10 homolog n=1 Tax=Microplitis mediator TaxID=375433 RepID=UPI00255666B8|nr:kelch domain-containing protein 10 homolog [Microplitis mediator]